MDYKLFLAGNSKIAESLRKLAAALQELEDAEIESLVSILPEETGELLGESVRLLRSRERPTCGASVGASFGQILEPSVKE